MKWEKVSKDVSRLGGFGLSGMKGMVVSGGGDGLGGFIREICVSGFGCKG